jgi:hypothetical protein
MGFVGLARTQPIVERNLSSPVNNRDFSAVG